MKYVFFISVAVIACFLVCWTPYHVQRIIFLFTTLTESWSKRIASIQGTLHVVSGMFEYMYIMAIRVVEFLDVGYKIRKTFADESTYQKEIIEFLTLINGELSKSAKIWLSKSIWYVNNHPKLSHFSFSLKNTNLGAHFLLLPFFDKINF